MGKYVIGLDFGSDSVRALVVDTRNGKEIAKAEANYRRWAEGLYCKPEENQYRQHPLDHIEALENCVRDLLAQCPEAVVYNIAGISVSSTASTPVLTDSKGIPLALYPCYEENPDAMFVLWKDHTAIEEADRINDVARNWHTDYTEFCGGTYSCEWVWAKMLHCIRQDSNLLRDAYSWTEHCDWITGMLCGHLQPETMRRSRCAAGHKAMWNERWGGLPEWSFFSEVDPLLDVFKGHLYTKTVTGDKRIGGLCQEWARRLGLAEGVTISIGAIDCHVGAVGAGIVPGTLVKVMGTSTCDIITDRCGARTEKAIRGICGQVEGSVLPGLTGFEAGQSAFGDVYAWFSRFTGRSIESLTAQAAELPLTEQDPVALDWFNGRRSPDADPRVKAAIQGLTMASTPAGIFKALVEATAFGSKAILERFGEEGIRIKEIVAIGGIANKSPFIMQTMADIIGLPIKVLASTQACALGAAIFAAVAADIYPDIPHAQKAMSPGYSAIYSPDPARQGIYTKLYSRYLELGAFVSKS